MTTYNAAAVSDTAIAYKNGITLQQGRALRDNPLAQSEGATDAPYILPIWHPYDGVTVGDGNDGEVWSFGTDGAVSEIETPDFEDGYEYRFVVEGLTDSSGSTLTLQLYGATTAAYTASEVVAAIGSTAAYGQVEMHRARIAAPAHIGVSTVLVVGATPTSPILVSLVNGTTEKILRAKFVSAGTFNAGAVYLHRRRVY